MRLTADSPSVKQWISVLEFAFEVRGKYKAVGVAAPKSLYRYRCPFTAKRGAVTVTITS